MSCDRQRKRLFGLLTGGQAFTAPLGGPVIAGDMLDLVFEVAQNQPPPEDAAAARAAALAAAASTQAMMRMAKETHHVTLHPHKTKSGLPDLPAQQGWRAIHELLTAMEQQQPLPPIAQDALGVLAFRKYTRFSQIPWEPSLTPATRHALRYAWGVEPERVVALMRGGLGGEEHAPFLRYLTEQLAADPQFQTNRPLLAAARHYLALDEAEMLEPEQRAGWARVVGAAAGVGLGIASHQRGDDICPKCGQDHIGNTCVPAYRNTLPQIASAVAVALAEPINAALSADHDPRRTLRELLDGWEEQGIPPDAPAWVHGLLAAQRALDRALIVGMTARADGSLPLALDETIIRDATIRTPLMLDGKPYIWDTGHLYPEATYRKHMRWQNRADFFGGSLLTGPDQTRYAAVQILGEHIAPLMAGQPMQPGAFRWPVAQISRRYEREQVLADQLRPGDTVVEPCGCLMRLVERRGRASAYERLGAPPPTCATHPQDSFIVSKEPQTRLRVDISRPRFSVSWPEPEAGGGEA